MNPTQERIWYTEHQVRTNRAKPGKAVRRMWPDITDGQVQDLAGYFTGGFDVEITSDPQVWVDAYKAISSCMQGKGALCERAYAPHGVQIAVLRDQAGLIVARMLLRNGLANRAYGSQSHTLVAALTRLGGVTLSSGWLDDIAADIATVEYVEPEATVWVSVPARFWIETKQGPIVRQGVGLVPTAAPGCVVTVLDLPTNQIEFVEQPNRIRTKRSEVVFRPYLDTH